MMRTVPEAGGQVAYNETSHVTRHASRVARHTSRTLQSLTVHVAAQSGASYVLVEGVALKRNPCVMCDA